MSASTKSSDGRVEEEVSAAIENYNAAVEARNPHAQVAFFAESYAGSGGMTKAELLAYFTDEIEQGRDVAKRFVLDDAKVVVDEDTAMIDPVTLRSPTGGGTFEIRMKREQDGVWRCESLTGSRSGYETAESARSLRERILKDPARPGYHFVVPEGIAMPFDPNGAIYWKGRYHLFYIFQDTRLGRKADHWGHVSSTDLFHWVHHPTGLLDGMYSGNCFINADGVPTICYHQKGLGNALAVA